MKADSFCPHYISIWLICYTCRAPSDWEQARARFPLPPPSHPSPSSSSSPQPDLKADDSSVMHEIPAPAWNNKPWMDIAFEGESGESTEGGVIPGKKSKNHLERVRTKSPPHAFGINSVWSTIRLLVWNNRKPHRINLRWFLLFSL